MQSVCSLKKKKKKSVQETGFVVTVCNLDKIGTFDLNDPLCKDSFMH